MPCLERYNLRVMTRSAIQDVDREEVARFVEEHYHSRVVMSRGRKFHPHEEEGFIERQGGEIVGLLTDRIEEQGMEILTLNSELKGQGIGTALMLAAIDKARHRECRRIWLTTTNDNLAALRFYQKLGFRIIEVNVGAVDEARKIKPTIPEVGLDGIEIHDEIVLALVIEPFLDE